MYQKLFNIKDNITQNKGREKFLNSHYHIIINKNLSRPHVTQFDNLTENEYEKDTQSQF